MAHARSVGAGVVFSGWGGDQAATWRGGGGLGELFWLGRWRPLWRALSRRADLSGNSRWRIFRSAVLIESLPVGIRRLLRREASTEIKTYAPAGTIRTGEIPGRYTGPFTQRRRISWLSHWWLPAHLEQFAQRGARHGISYAYPFLDRNLIDFALTIPGIMMTEAGLDRMPFRRAMKGVLPESVRLRKEKLAPWPLEGVRIARDRARLADEVALLKQHPMACRYVDFDTLEIDLASWTDADSLLEEIAKDARAGIQADPGDGALCNAIALAHMIALGTAGTDV